jgi:DNA-binding response OmpR family regulator
MSEAALRERIDYLEAENAGLRQQLAIAVADDFVLRCHDTFRLTLSESRILHLLVRRAQVAKASMYEALYGERIAGPEPKILDVLVHRIRRKLEPHEVVVETVTGVGYRLAPDMRAKIEALLS